jgi:hypothetical protein
MSTLILLPARIARPLAVAGVACMLLAGCASGNETNTARSRAKSVPCPTFEEKWGVQIASIRMSAAGRIVDFRYRVIDPEKAALLGDRRVQPVLIDQTSGRKLAVPVAPKIGSLRQTSVKLTAGRIYFVLFSNSEQLIKSGSKVAVVIGDFRAENLMVE